MRVEKKLDEQAKTEGKKSDLEAREFAHAVFAALDQMPVDEPAEGNASTEAERLASVFSFLRTLVVEYMRQVRNYPDTMGAERERIRVAIEAFTMLSDITRKRRHPVHKFFRGAAQNHGSRQPTSREAARNCILMAAVGALIEAGAQQEMKQAAAIRLLKSRPGIGQHMPKEGAFANVILRWGLDPEYMGYVRDYRAMMEWDCDTSTESILSWTEMAINSREGPLDLRAATTIRQLGVVRHSPDGGAVLMRPRPVILPTLPSRLAPLPLAARKAPGLDDGKS